MKKVLVSVFCATLLFISTGCGPNSDIEVEIPEQTIELNTPGPNPLVGETGANNRIAGLGQGLWHGLIAPVTLVISLFNEEVQMYEVHNNGREYNLGYLIGVAIIFLLLGITGRRWR
jgi:hypothetical protein